MESIDLIRGSDGNGNASVATVQATRSPMATTIQVNTTANWTSTFIATMGTPHTFVDPVTSEQITVISEATAVDFRGHLDGGNIEIDSIAPGYTDLGSQVGDIIIIKPTTEWANNVAEVLEVSHNDDGTLNDAAILQVLAAAYPIGSIYVNAGVDTNPATLLGFGTWTAFGAGKVMVGLDSGDAGFDTLEETGGSKTVSIAHTHDVNGTTSAPSAGAGVTAGATSSPTSNHTHSFSVTSGAMSANSTPSIVQPYIVVQMWKRTA